MAKDVMTTPRDKAASIKRPYAPPHLMVFGDLRSLTQAGSSGKTEKKAGQNKKKP